MKTIKFFVFIALTVAQVAVVRAKSNEKGHRKPASTESVYNCMGSIAGKEVDLRFPMLSKNGVTGGSGELKNNSTEIKVKVIYGVEHEEFPFSLGVIISHFEKGVEVGKAIAGNSLRGEGSNNFPEFVSYKGANANLDCHSAGE